MGDVAEIVGGGTPSTKKSEYWNGNINWFSPAEIGNQIFVSHSQKQITELGLLKSSAKMLPAGTILFTSRAGIGNTAILTRNACTNQGFQSIVPNSHKLDSYFIYSESAKLKRYGETMGSGSTFTEVSGKQMRKMPLHIPNITEQAKIGNMIKILDQTITLHEEKKRQLECLKSALLQKMFADQSGYPAVRFKGFGDEWEQCKLGDVAKINSGKDYKGLQPGKIPVYGTGGYMLSVNDKLSDIDAIGIGRKGTIDKPYYLNAPFWTVDTLFYVTPRGTVDISFMFPLFKNINWKRYDESTGVPSLSKNTIKKIRVSFPQNNEQVKIGDLFQKITQIITLHDQKLRLLKYAKQSLFQKMFI